MNWLNEDFGHGAHEYTTVAHHKADACAECSFSDKNVNSMKMFMRRYASHLGDRILQRKQNMEMLKKQMRECADEKKSHRVEAAAAQDV